MVMRTKTREEKIKELKEWFGWDNEMLAHFTPRDLSTLSKAMLLEKANLEKTNKEGERN